ncbi:unnamed protein product, partial [Laminaria digitata]
FGDYSRALNRTTPVQAASEQCRLTTVASEWVHATRRSCERQHWRSLNPAVPLPKNPLAVPLPGAPLTHYSISYIYWPAIYLVSSLDSLRLHPRSAAKNIKVVHVG